MPRASAPPKADAQSSGKTLNTPNRNAAPQVTSRSATLGVLVERFGAAVLSRVINCAIQVGIRFRRRRLSRSLCLPLRCLRGARIARREGGVPRSRNPRNRGAFRPRPRPPAWGARGTESLQTPCWREPDSNLYGAFPVKSFFGLLSVLCSERESRSSSRRLRLGSRSARKGSRDRNGSRAWRLAA